MVKIKYSCALCGINKRELEVNPRDPERDVVAWVDSLKGPLLIDHSMQSPQCPATTITELMIPAEGEYVGQDGTGYAEEAPNA